MGVACFSKYNHKCSKRHWSHNPPGGAFQSFSLSMVSHFGNNTPQVHQSMKKYSSSQMAHLPVAASQNSTEEIMVEFASMPPGTIMMIIMSIMVMDS